MKKKLLYLLGAIVIVVLFFGVVYGYKTFKFYQEKAEIAEKQDEIIAELEKADIEHIQSQEALIRQLKEKERLISQLDTEINRLENLSQNILVPSNPNDLVNAFRAKGFKSAIILNKP